ncbi:hypothetical protein GCM10010428_21870 [Actinosynnema pretiosum subsp. pretiosum]
MASGSRTCLTGAARWAVMRRASLARTRLVADGARPGTGGIGAVGSVSWLNALLGGLGTEDNSDGGAGPATGRRAVVFTRRAATVNGCDRSGERDP